MSKKQFYYAGKLVEIVANVPNNATKVIVKVIADYRDNEVNACEELYVDVSALEEPIDFIFNIGDPVKSTLGGYNADNSLTGTVTAFEYHTNKVVVQSNKIAAYNNKRTRYAYTQDEVEYNRAHKYYELEKGKFYKINNDLNVMAVKQPGDEELLMLITKHGIVVYENLAPLADKAGLALNDGISNIQEVKGWGSK